jgi:ferredoxin-like protein FixX
VLELSNGKAEIVDLDGCMECGACAEQLDHTKQLEQLGIEVKYTGELLTQLLKGEEY